jgi:hypothetical protein
VGVFDVGFICEHGTLVRGQSVIGRPRACPNHLMWRAHDRLLTKILPPQTGTLSWEIGFSGPMFRGKYQRPNWDQSTWTFDRRGKYSDFVGDWGNEGGAAAQDVRELFGYQRQPVTWTVERDKHGAMISTDWHTWQNQVSWGRHGDWTPEEWDEIVLGPYPQPSDWIDCPTWEDQNQGFPWCTPRIHPDWWTNNEFGVNCTSCQAHSPVTISHYPVGCCFLVIKKSGEADEAFAAAVFTGPTFLRLGGKLVCRYRGRFG